MAYERGEIYFVRETAKELELGRTPFVKVGLVKKKENRDSFGRLSEHQTGNPRTLFINRDDIVHTDAVTRIEALLHRIFANKRINGEWFQLETESEIQEVIDKARELAEEIKPFIPKFDQAEQLKNLASNGKTKTATEQDITNAKLLAAAKLKLKMCKSLKSEITQLLTVIYNEGGNVSGAAGTQITKFEPVFDEEKFKAENAEIWESYLAEESKWFQSFLPKDKSITLEDLDDEIQKDFASIKEVIDAVAISKDVALLNEPNLKLTNIEGIAKWEEDLLVAELKISTGEYEAIEGVCSWKRLMKYNMKLNTGLLMAEKPDLYKNYISTPDPKEYVVPKRKKV
jgi:hypothetical protein